MESQSIMFVPGPDNILKESVSLLYKQLLLSQLLSVQSIGFWKLKNMDFWGIEKVHIRSKPDSSQINS